MSNKKSPDVEDRQQKTSTSVGVRNKKRSPDKKKKKRRDSTKLSNLSPSRRIRTRTRKPKYLSLKLELISSDHEQPEDNKKRTHKKKHKNSKSKTSPFQGADQKPKDEMEEQKEQLKLSPPHPENLVDKEGYSCYQCDSVTAYLFNSTTDSATISSINDLLDSTDAATTTSDDGMLLSPYAHDHVTSSSSLVRTAMRRGANEEAKGAAEEERWVSYTEVVEEVMSRSGTPLSNGDEDCQKNGSLSLALKLDYKQILEAWSDKGPLYVDGEPPQTVPDLHAKGLLEGWGSVGSLWAVPELEETERSKRDRREASLLRYKEKRQTRLFYKRIRYEVRKLNAEKRPRIKGRFVKRVDQ